MKRATEVGGLISQHIDDLHQIVPNTWKRRTMYAVARCRTAAMGGHMFISLEKYTRISV
jgi:hypothetical protein